MALLRHRLLLLFPTGLLFLANSAHGFLSHPSLSTFGPLRDSASSSHQNPVAHQSKVDSANVIVQQKEEALDNSALALKEIRHQLQTQQEQINQLIRVWKKTNSGVVQGEKSTPPTPQLVPPLKAMLFIDGTWLYYSIYERGPRECPIIAKYGRGWQRHYAIDWTLLPTIINKHLTLAVRRFSERPLEIVRSSVFTSYKANTSPSTYRYKLFEDLKKANFDVHMMETVGNSEKCVDIQLAVEMLHHATDSGGSYDIAILLTGDKDFIPAIIRTRQKGKMFSLVSMKAGCNRALVDLPGMRDFDVLWVDNHLDELMYQHESVSLRAILPMDEYTIHKVTQDFIEHSGFAKVSSRDLGRYLKSQTIGGISFLESCKDVFGSIYHFLAADESYFLAHDSQKEDSNFWISLTPEAHTRLEEMKEKSNLSEAENAFFEKYSTAILSQKDIVYGRTLLQDSISADDSVEFDLPATGDTPIAAQQESTTPNNAVDDSLSKIELKELCRELGLKVSGTKAELIARINEQSNGNQSAPVPPQPPSVSVPSAGERQTDFLLGLVVEFMRANNGRVGSRNMGRYLAANNGRTGTGTALQDLKGMYGSLSNFLSTYSDLFSTHPHNGETAEFDIVFKNNRR